MSLFLTQAVVQCVKMTFLKRKFYSRLLNRWSPPLYLWPACAWGCLLAWGQWIHLLFYRCVNKALLSSRPPHYPQESALCREPIRCRGINSRVRCLWCRCLHQNSRCELRSFNLPEPLHSVLVRVSSSRTTTDKHRISVVSHRGCLLQLLIKPDVGWLTSVHLETTSSGE